MFSTTKKQLDLLTTQSLQIIRFHLYKVKTEDRRFPKARQQLKNPKDVQLNIQ